ncbi:GlxA family transcriptional regulator [Halomonas korlensis]|uniref:Transcriptional regulator GlxA family, contains an amidase domain and an AraC-type DNA-binding HTH domain n=1 Tax=Halomonas korlensis TaxID=463301 RepID=A0A1I7I9F1_9GAMM|nr:GlxA family transcriptional regulator [Halomonas korlensis]SFU69446.1 Transcriptional regulator GlxA family, contains an amidase domain and an AraC-type DNA-binding HTH domain [Halomonas korlensis]
MTRYVGVVVLPGFSLLAQACATEPLAVANQLADRALYRLSTFALDERAVASQSRQWLLPQAGIGEALAGVDMLLVCAQTPLAPGDLDRLSGWLRWLAARGVVLGGIGGGVEVLARAGLLEGYRATLPWQRFEAVAQACPRIHLSRQLFEIDRDRLTCGGGTAAMDMMMTLIAAQQGSSLAERVSEHFVLERVRMGDEPQQASLRARLGHAPESLLEAVALMKANIEEPLSTHELGEHLGISRRQLERLFKKYLQAVPSRYYLNLRLQQARRLLRDSDLPAGEIALATGFSSAAHFSTAYRHHFGVSPREERLM